MYNNSDICIYANVSNAIFSQNKKKCLECSETKECANIFCGIYARVSIKTFSHYFFSFRAKVIFLSKTYISIHVEKNLHKNSLLENATAIHVEKNLHKNSLLENASAKNAFFLDVLPSVFNGWGRIFDKDTVFTQNILHHAFAKKEKH